MKNIKIIYFDIDGTLVDMKKKVISQTMLDTLYKLKEKGIKICIATGRPPFVVPKFDIEFDAYLTFNGSYCFQKDKVLYHNPIPHEDVIKIIENASKINRHVTVASNLDIDSNGYDNDLDDYFRIANQELYIKNKFNDLLEQDIYQMMIGGNQQVYDQVLKNTKNAKATAWWNRAADIIPADGGKGKAVEKINEYFGFTKEQSMAFGDGTNDIDMLQAVGLGVAMGNATQNVKDIADDICDSVENEGITSYCKQLNLI